MKKRYSKISAALAGGLLAAALAAPAESLRSDVVYLLPQESRVAAFVDLKALRATPHYLALRERLLSPRIAGYDRFLRSAGIDFDRDVDWVAWVRVPTRGGGLLLAVAGGRFNLAAAERFYLQQRIPLDAYRGQTLFPLRGAAHTPPLYLTFLDSTTAALGSRAALELLLETRYGGHANLLRNEPLAQRLNEVNGRAPAWAVLDAEGTRGLLAQLFPEAAKFPEYTQLVGSLQSSSLQITPAQQAGVELTVWCDSATSAQKLAHLLQTAALAQSWQTPGTRPGVQAVMGRVEAQSAGNRVVARAALSETDVARLLERGRR